MNDPGRLGTGVRDKRWRVDRSPADIKLVSVQVGRPRDVPWHGRVVSTGIYKEPVTGRIMLRRFNLDGDQQADLTVHGGPAKAVYVYPSEHYPVWQVEFPDMQLAYGTFGENFTTEGLDESSVCIGDQFRIGEAVVEVSQPRMPCYKLGIRFGRPDMPKRFHTSGRCGFYLTVLQEGEVGAGDVWERLAQGEQVSVTERYRQLTNRYG